MTCYLPANLSTDDDDVLSDQAAQTTMIVMWRITSDKQQWNGEREKCPAANRNGTWIDWMKNANAAVDLSVSVSVWLKWRAFLCVFETITLIRSRRRVAFANQTRIGIMYDVASRVFTSECVQFGTKNSGFKAFNGGGEICFFFVSSSLAFFCTKPHSTWRNKEYYIVLRGGGIFYASIQCVPCLCPTLVSSPLIPLRWRRRCSRLN